MLLIEKLTKTYSDGMVTHALNDISMRVERGEFVIISGPSGSGKTTLLNMIGAMDTPSSGKITYDGVEISSLSENELAAFRRNHIGFVFQLFNLLPHLSVIENVILPLAPYQKKLNFRLEEKALELLRVVGLEKKVNQFPNQLSGGEQQRVAIARALINTPKLLLADEPTGNLDSKSGLAILQLMAELNKNYHTTLILVTHNSDYASWANRSLTMVDGKLI